MEKSQKLWCGSKTIMQYSHLLASSWDLRCTLRYWLLLLEIQWTLDPILFHPSNRLSAVPSHCNFHYLQFAKQILPSWSILRIHFPTGIHYIIDRQGAWWWFLQPITLLNYMVVLEINNVKSTCLLLSFVCWKGEDRAFGHQWIFPFK